MGLSHYIFLPLDRLIICTFAICANLNTLTCRTSGNLPSVPPSSEEESAADILTKMCQFSDLASLEVPSPFGEASQATLSTVSHESLESQDILESLESPVLQDVLVPEASEAHHSRQQSETSLPSAGSHKQGTLGSVPYHWSGSSCRSWSCFTAASFDTPGWFHCQGTSPALLQKYAIRRFLASAALA